MLVGNYLVAVVSLPAGCFHPYSGVKTSILVLDQSVASRAKPSPSSKSRATALDSVRSVARSRRTTCPQVQAELAADLEDHGIPETRRSVKIARPPSESLWGSARTTDATQTW